MSQQQSSEVKKELVCESCGASFTCYPVPGACWCSEVKLAEAARKELREQYTHCLCPDCLVKHAAENQRQAL